MRLQPPIYTLTDTPFPYTTRFRSVVAFSASPWLTGLALMAAGGAWMVSVTIFNIGVQTMSPRWVAGRVLAAFQTAVAGGLAIRSEEHTSELQSLMRISYAVFCLKQKLAHPQCTTTI